MWMKFAQNRKGIRTAENGPILRCFYHLRLTGSKSEDCYTFEHFASDRDVIHSPYYYHYKRNRVRLKEESKWS